MSLSSIRSQIKTVLEGVSGIGPVYARERWSADWNKFLTLFKASDDKINACMFARSQLSSKWASIGQKENAHIFTVRFLMGMNDAAATGTFFDDLLEAAADAFDDNLSLGGSYSICPDWGPMSGEVGLQISTIDMRLFGNVLCHYAEGRLCVMERVTI